MGELLLEHSKSEKLSNDGLFLSKAYNVSAKTFKRNYLSWNWKVMENLKENWLVASKIAKGILLIFMWRVENLEIHKLMGPSSRKHIKIGLLL